jgi:succinyl-diaminopimelate desuccinylase
VIDPVRLTQELIRCPSVTPDEAGALTLLQSVLEPMGFVCHRMTFSAPGTPDVENLYARLGTSGPNICFAGHTDVVPPGDANRWTAAPFGGEVRGPLLYGRGAVDMKGAIACFVAAVARERASISGGGSISLLITSDEEGPSVNGTARVVDWLRERGEGIDACIVGEPSNPTTLGEEIKIGRRGSLNAWLTVRGKQGHVAYPQLAANPITGLVRVLEALKASPLDDGTAHFAASNLEITTIDVGNPTVNIIPAEAVARLNVRYNDRHTAATLERHLAEMSERVLASGGVAHDWRFVRSGDAFLTQPGPFVDRLVGAVAAVTGRTPALTTSGGTSDARFIKNLCPVVEFGLVNATIHQIDEHVALADLAALTDIYARFLRATFTDQCQR